MENAVQKPVKMKFKVDNDMAAKKRQCSCTIGEYNKEGVLVPPNKLAKRKDKYITAMMVPDMVTNEMKEAYLGNSKGI